MNGKEAGTKNVQENFTLNKEAQNSPAPVKPKKTEGEKKG